MQGVFKARKAAYTQASEQVAKLEKKLAKAQKPRKLKQEQLRSLKSQVRPSCMGGPAHTTTGGVPAHQNALPRISTPENIPAYWTYPHGHRGEGGGTHVRQLRVIETSCRHAAAVACRAMH